MEIPPNASDEIKASALPLKYVLKQDDREEVTIIHVEPEPVITQKDIWALRLRHGSRGDPFVTCKLDREASKKFEEVTEEAVQYKRPIAPNRSVGLRMPVVIGEMGVDGYEPMGWIEVFRKQQAAVAAMPEFKNNVRLATTAHLWPTYPNLDDEWQQFRAKAQAREKLAKEQGRKLTDAGDFYQREWVQRYKKELSYTSDKRYHYKGSGSCYYLMGEALARAMLEMVK